MHLLTHMDVVYLVLLGKSYIVINTPIFDHVKRPQMVSILQLLGL